MSQLFLIAALVAAVALAQPAVNAPLLPQSSYITGGGYRTVTGVVLASNYAFTADSNGVWGTNISKPSNEESPFWDALPGVTQMWAWCSNWTNANTCNLHVIAGPAVALYDMNETSVWRATMFLAENVTFNILTDLHLPTSFMYPVMLPMTDGSGYFYVLGSQNISTNYAASLSSMVYAFNVMDLSVVWSTVLNSDTSNFQTANCSEYVWILTQNQSFGYSGTVVQKLNPVDGTLLDWSLYTMMSDNVQYISVASGQFMVLGIGGSLTFGFYNGTTIALDFNIPYVCVTMPYAPMLINSTWYAICGFYVEMWDSVSYVRQAPFMAPSAIHCAAVNEVSNDFVLSDFETVYVGNASGISQLIKLPDSVGPDPEYEFMCTGASFNWVSSKHLPTFDNITEIVYLSYFSVNSGSVLAINYRTGAVIAQAAADVTPLGGAIVDWEKRRLYTASLYGNILQGYQFVPMITSKTSFIADLSGWSSSSVTFSIAYNATSRITYYIAAYNLLSVDDEGEIEMLANFSYYVSSSVQPVIVGQFLVFSNSYNYNNVQVWDSVKEVLTTLYVDDIDNSVNFLVSGMKVIAFVQTYSISAYVVDLSASPLAATAITADSYRQVSGAAVVGTTLVINTGGSLSGFDLNKDTYTTPVFVQSSLNILSAPVAFNNEAYFIGCPALMTMAVAWGNSVFSVTASGWMTKVGELPTQCTTETKTLSIKSGGVFGGAIMYIIGSQNVTAYTTSWTILFNYVSDQTIITVSSPTVLDTGAICFFTTYAFTVVGGFKGGLAWYYNASSNNYPVLTDNTTIFFSDGQYVIGADTFSGAVTSLSTYGGLSTISGYAIAAGETSTTVVGATDYGHVFANQVPAEGPSGSFAGSAQKKHKSDLSISNILQLLLSFFN